MLELCGQLPLAITMVGAMARGIPDPWPELLQRLRASAIEALSTAIPGYPHSSLGAAIQASLSALEPPQRQRYAELAILLGMPAVPREVIVRLWGLNGWMPLQSGTLLRILVDRSLAFHDAETDSFWLHDLQADYLRQYGRSDASLHRALVDSYRADCAGSWAALPDDGYVLERIGHHLHKAGMSAELEALLIDVGWLTRAVGALGVDRTVAVYRDIPSKSELAELVLRCLRLSAQQLAADPRQLAAHLVGRLGFVGDAVPGADELVERARAAAPRPWLEPRSQSLESPRPLMLTRALGEWTELVSAAGDDIYLMSGKDLTSGQDVLRLDLHTGELTPLLHTPFHPWTIWVSASAGRVAMVEWRYGLGRSKGRTEVWDLVTRSLVARRDGTPAALALLPDGAQVLLADGPRLLRWNTGTGQVIELHRAAADIDLVIPILEGSRVGLRAGFSAQAA